MFGLSFRSHDQWKANLPDIKNGFTMVQFEAGPHAGNTGDVFPNIVVIVRPPKPGETLNDFQLSFLHGATARPVNVAVCPSQECLTVEIVQPTFYKLEGGGHFIAVVFKRDSPEFPGLPFEQAQSLPTTGSQQPQVFHAGERFHRLAEPLYYLVGLDTADSILVPAKHDYEEFLKTLKVD
jgi:hypothetical protein